MFCLVDEESLYGCEYKEDEGGNDPDLSRNKVLLPLLPPVAGSQRCYEVSQWQWSDRATDTACLSCWWCSA